MRYEGPARTKTLRLQCDFSAAQRNARWKERLSTARVGDKQIWDKEIVKFTLRNALVAGADATSGGPVWHPRLLWSAHCAEEREEANGHVRLYDRNEITGVCAATDAARSQRRV